MHFKVTNGKFRTPLLNIRSIYFLIWDFARIFFLENPLKTVEESLHEDLSGVEKDNKKFLKSENLWSWSKFTLKC